MQTLSFSRKMEQGSWKFAPNGMLNIACPDCGFVTTRPFWKVSDDGVCENFVCANADCNFKSDIELDQYE